MRTGISCTPTRPSQWDPCSWPEPGSCSSLLCAWVHISGTTAALETTSCGFPQAPDPTGPAGFGARPGSSDAVAFFYVAGRIHLQCGAPRGAILSGTSLLLRAPTVTGAMKPLRAEKHLQRLPASLVILVLCLALRSARNTCICVFPWPGFPAASPRQAGAEAAGDSHQPLRTCFV